MNNIFVNNLNTLLKEAEKDFNKSLAIINEESKRKELTRLTSVLLAYKDVLRPLNTLNGLYDDVSSLYDKIKHEREKMLQGWELL